MGSNTSTQINQARRKPATIFQTSRKLAVLFPPSILHQAITTLQQALHFFFIDQNLKIRRNQQDIALRFVVYNDEVNYNAIQALAQTAYATRSKLTIVFENPNLELLTEAQFIVNRGTTQKCFSISNLSGNIASINCPVQSIELDMN